MDRGPGWSGKRLRADRAAGFGCHEPQCRPVQSRPQWTAPDPTATLNSLLERYSPTVNDGYFSGAVSDFLFEQAGKETFQVIRRLFRLLGLLSFLSGTTVHIFENGFDDQAFRRSRVPLPLIFPFAA